MSERDEYRKRDFVLLELPVNIYWRPHLFLTLLQYLSPSKERGKCGF